MADPFDVDLPGGGRGRAVEVRTWDGLDDALTALAVSPGPAVLLLGGARLEPVHEVRIERFLEASLLPAVAAVRGILVDGGTDTGVMRLAGQARATVGGSVTLVGVVPNGKVRVPGSSGTTELARGHTHFVVVPGEAWGDESGWLLPIAGRLSLGQVSTVLVNGGPIALEELEWSLARGGRILVVDGTGRAADHIAAATRRPAMPESPLFMPAAGAITVVDAAVGMEELARALFESALGERR